MHNRSIFNLYDWHYNFYDVMWCDVCRNFLGQNDAQNSGLTII